MFSIDAFNELIRSLTARRHRALLWISAPADEAVSRALFLWQARAWQAPLWLGPDSELSKSVPDIIPLPTAKARTRLGSEHDLIVFDAVSSGAGFDPDAFGAVSGTVRAGGLLILLTPESWSEGLPAPDDDYVRLAAWPHRAEALSAHYLARLAHVLSDSSLALHWQGGESFPVPEWPSPASRNSLPEDTDCLTVDQVEAVSYLTRLRRRRPLVLTADRGRGKSASLGIAAARRLQAGETRLWITAPRPASVEPVFERLKALLPLGGREGNTFCAEVKGAHAEVRFLAPDAVLEALQSGEVDPRSPPTLFVDEAAAIPSPLLGRWLAAFPRIAFATTVHGYEGTGRGFALRFRERLERDTPDWRELHLHQPVRWAENDPLEALTRKLLLLDAEPARDAAVKKALKTQSVQWVCLERGTLAGDERRLSELFGLLVQAHYRTAPADLRQLLDGPEVHLLAAYADEVCVGVCLAQEEGGFPHELALAVAHGQRRPRGHLLAQSLAAHGGHHAAAEARWCRITRIAVHPAARRLGIGRQSVEHLGELMASQGIDRLGVSFGAEEGLLAFWHALGFISLRLGLSREAASGEHALMMGRTLARSSQAGIARLSADFQALLPNLLAFELGRLEPVLAASLLKEGDTPCVDATTLARISWFAQGGGELASVRPWLATAWLAWWRDPGRKESDPELVAFAGPLFQTTTHAGHGGRKARLAHWRSLAGRLRDYLMDNLAS